jgi:hypothetical protein
VLKSTRLHPDPVSDSQDENMAFIHDKQDPSDSNEYITDYASDASDSLVSSTFLSATRLADNGHRVRDGGNHPRQRANTRRKEEQRQRLLRCLVQALQQGEQVGQGQSNTSTQRRRPRPVLLGNQKTLILGVVLSDRGAAAAAADVVGRE